MSLEFFEGNHTFLLDGEPIPSVSEVLRPLQEDSFKAINPMVLQAAAERGTAVHEICECIDYEMDYEDMLTPELVSYADAYEEFLRDHDCDWLGIETQVHFYDQYAGIVDRFGYVDGDPAVLDIKTVQSPSIEQKVSVCCQLYAYDRAIKGCFNDMQSKHMAHFTLYLKKDGTYRLMDCRDLAAKEDFDPALIWGNLFFAYEFKKMAKDIIDAIKQKHRRK